MALTWAGIPPIAITPPTGARAVSLNSQNDAVGVASITTTEVDYYSFTPSVTGTYVISASTPSSSVDTVVGLFSASGARLAYNDDIVPGVNTDSRIALNLAAGRRYYFGITNYTASSRGAYTWSIDGPSSAAADDGYENNDSFGTAYNLGTLTASRTVSSLVMADSQDWYRFTTTGIGTSGNSVSIVFQNARGNLNLALYDSSGRLLTSSQGTGNSETISLNGRVAGTYYVLVTGNLGALNPNYTLSINPPAASAPPTPINPTPTPTPTPGGFQITLSMTGLTPSQQSIFQAAANRWAQVIVGDLPNATYNGQTVDDLLISASSRAIDGVGGILGQAGPDALRSGSRLPYHGVMQFDSADMASMESSGLLFSVVLHEMGHILGIGTVWQSLGLLSGAGTGNPIFVGAQATAAYNQLFGTSVSGVPVENTGGSGTANAHWRETVFTTELMTGWAGPGTSLPLSVVTVASLADIGYQVNYAAADSFRSTAPFTPVFAQAGATSAWISRLIAAGFITSDTDSNLPPLGWPTDDSGNRVRIEPPRSPDRSSDVALIDTVMADWRQRCNEGPSDLVGPGDDNPDPTAQSDLAGCEFDWLAAAV